MTIKPEVLIVENDLPVVNDFIRNDQALMGLSTYITITTKEDIIKKISPGMKFQKAIIDPGGPGIASNDIPARVDFACTFLDMVTNKNNAIIYTGFGTKIERNEFSAKGYKHYITKDESLSHIAAIINPNGVKYIKSPGSEARETRFTFLNESENRAIALVQANPNATIAQIACFIRADRAQLAASLSKAKRKLEESGINTDFLD